MGLYFGGLPFHNNLFLNLIVLVILYWISIFFGFLDFFDFWKFFQVLFRPLYSFLFQHATISGQICPYCESKWGWKKFDHLDDHVTKHHVLEMQSPVQTW